MAINNYEHRGRPRWISAVALFLPMIAAGCYSGGTPWQDDGEPAPEAGEDPEPGPGDDQAEPLDGPGECVDTRTFFAEEVFRPVLQAKCYACHNANGAAKNTDFLLQGDDFPGDAKEFG